MQMFINVLDIKKKKREGERMCVCVCVDWVTQHTVTCIYSNLKVTNVSIAVFGIYR